MINYFTSFKSNLDKIKIPKIFDYPFSYEPQKIAKIATIELQKYIYLINLKEIKPRHHLQLLKTFHKTTPEPSRIKTVMCESGP